MSGMSAGERVAGYLIAYAVLVDASNDCDALDEVVVASESWAAAAELMRTLGYRKVPGRPSRTTVPSEALHVAFSTPGAVFRKRFMSNSPWVPFSKDVT